MLYATAISYKFVLVIFIYNCELDHLTHQIDFDSDKSKSLKASDVTTSLALTYNIPQQCAIPIVRINVIAGPIF